MKQKTILITGSTDGIGKLAGIKLLNLGHRVIFHGRSVNKLEAVKASLGALTTENADFLESDLSSIAGVRKLATGVIEKECKVDCVVNNAGVFKVTNSITDEGLDMRFMVNTIAPYLLVRHLLNEGCIKERIINLSSAAQSPINDFDFRGNPNDSDSTVYAKSKVAITMWSRSLAEELADSPIAVIALNPASFLGSNMVKQAYGVEGKDINIGADIIVRSCLDESFKSRSGQYFDNDIGDFADAHRDVYDSEKRAKLLRSLDRFREGI